MTRKIKCGAVSDTDRRFLSLSMLVGKKRMMVFLAGLQSLRAPTCCEFLRMCHCLNGVVEFTMRPGAVRCGLLECPGQHFSDFESDWRWSIKLSSPT